MTSRAYREGDLRLMLELCQELWPDVRCTFGQIAFWAAQLLRDDWQARLWFDGDRLVAWGWKSPGDLEYEGRADVLDEVLAWGEPERVIRPEADAELLARHGLRPDPGGPWYRINARPLGELEAPVVPEGYRLTTMAEHRDFASRSAAHRSAFAPSSRFFEDVYAVVRDSWAYRADLDCVCLAPDGSVASYALAWLDERNRLGELEPVGTHEAHRRRGLARATNLFALQRLRDEGAETGLVQCRGDGAYPVPALLYEAVGFREIARAVSFTRA